MPFSSKTTQESFRGRCVKRFFYPTKSGHNLPYRGEVRHERKLTWGRRVPQLGRQIAVYILVT